MNKKINNKPHYDSKVFKNSEEVLNKTNVKATELNVSDNNNQYMPKSNPTMPIVKDFNIFNNPTMPFIPDSQMPCGPGFNNPYMPNMHWNMYNTPEGMMPYMYNMPEDMMPWNMYNMPGGMMPYMYNMPDGIMPGMPMMPQMPITPGIPTMPQMPITPGIPTMPQMPTTPGMPTMPQMSSMPTMPNGDMPALPRIPIAPTMPQTPAAPAPTVPSTPGMPQMPGMPQQMPMQIDCDKLREIMRLMNCNDTTMK